MTSQMSAVLERLHGVKATAKGFRARCPAHDDRVSSLSVDPGSDGRVLVFCHAGCTAQAIVDAIGKSLSDLMPPSTGTWRPDVPVATKKVQANANDQQETTFVFLNKADAVTRGGRRVQKPGVCPHCHGALQVIVLAEPSEPDGPFVVAYCVSGCSADLLVMALSKLVPDVEFQSLSDDGEGDK